MDGRSITSRENGKKGGMPPKADTPLVKNLHELLHKHALEEIEVKFGDRVVRKARMLILYERLFELAQDKDKKIALQAIESYMNRNMGMPKASTDVTSGGEPIKFSWS